MAKFEEEKVINALHPEKAEVGKKYWFAENLLELKRCVVEENDEKIGELVKVVENAYDCPFCLGDISWQFLYPYEEPPKKRMTNIQFMEWLSKGNGVYKNQGDYAHSSCTEEVKLLDEEVDSDIRIRTWGSDEWLIPTVDIYERDCKGGKE